MFDHTSPIPISDVDQDTVIDSHEGVEKGGQSFIESQVLKYSFSCIFFKYSLFEIHEYYGFNFQLLLQVLTDIRVCFLVL